MSISALEAGTPFTALPMLAVRASEVRIGAMEPMPMVVGHIGSWPTGSRGMTVWVMSAVSEMSAGNYRDWPGTGGKREPRRDFDAPGLRPRFPVEVVPNPAGPPYAFSRRTPDLSCSRAAGGPRHD
jgi:hypothetical protein